MKPDEIKLLEWLYDRLNEQYNERGDVDYMLKFKKLIDSQKAQLLRDRYIIVIENDIGNDRWMESQADCYGSLCRRVKYQQGH